MTRTYSYLSIHRILSMALIAVTIISIFSYVTLTVATVFATAGRSRAAQQVALLTSKIGDLEGNYLTLGNSITQTQAQQLGFVMPKTVTLVTVSAQSVALSIPVRE